RTPRGEEPGKQQQQLASGAQVGHCSLMTAGRESEQFTTTGWPWRPGNRFRLLADCCEFFACMHEAIDAARALVLLKMYLVRCGPLLTRLADALLAAARRGARVCVVFHAFGS